MSPIHRAGRCAILGATNVGKSTLLNALLGQKVAIVSPVVQTTRKRILGVLHHAGSQIVLVDTPGLHRHRGALNKRLMQATMRTLDGVDAVLLMLDASRKRGFFDQHAAKLLPRIKEAGLSCIVALNKIDRVKKPSLLPMLQQLAGEHDFTAMVPVSAAKGDGLGELLDEIAAVMPEGDPLYDPEVFTDQTERDICCELVREKANFRLHDELPHSIAVTIEDFDESRRSDDGGLVSIDAVIWIERESQKAIVIGQGGSMIKAIGSAARPEMEDLLGCKVMLRLKVKVAPSWSDDPSALNRLGIGGE